MVDDLAMANRIKVPPAKEATWLTPATSRGRRLDGTSPGGPAEKAGLLRGDVILAVGDRKIDVLGDFMHALNSHKPGDVVTVRYLRDGTEETCQVTLESSQVE